MKNVFKYTALAVAFGLMGSSAAMAAGAPDNNTGTVSLHGNITASTCAVSWTTPDSSFNLEQSKIVGEKAGSDLTTVKQSFALNGCNGKELNFSLHATKPYPGSGALPDDVTASTAPFFMVPNFVSPQGITWPKSGKPYTEDQAVSMDGMDPLLIKPTSDAQTYNMDNKIKVGNGATSADNVQAKAYDLTYTYTVTYP